MSRDDIASCAEEKFHFNISCTIIDSNQNQIYIVPFNTKSILVWKIVDTNPSVIKIKEIIDEEDNQVYIYGLALSPNESCLAAILSDQSILLYQNKEYLRCLSNVRFHFFIFFCIKN
jgi:WD40 repeat protein